ncbi:unnamed protein product [Paramecium pentaurelia]|uniref:Uncharacterized protein n=1 Tax=Paramecium pentaurelia TaxID=43138 RepID=A0A8S1VRR8_9CILI|nr:unnamed protein product [Paramecium pentaurelia]
MNQKSFFTWFQLLLKRDQPIILDQSNWLGFVSEVLDVICSFSMNKIDLKGDIFQRQQIQSIIELLQKLINILKNFDENSINELLKFIFLISKEIPELEQLNLQIDEQDQYQMFQELNLNDNEIIQLSFSKYELLQIIEHVEDKYKQTKEQLEQILPQFEKAEENLKLSIIAKEEENKILNKQIEELIAEIDRLNIINAEQQIVVNQINEQHQCNPDHSQLLQYLQRQHSVIQEQEQELEELRKIFAKKQLNNIFQDKENYNNIQTLESRLFIYSEKLKELNQQVQTLQKDVVKLEIQKSLVEKKLEDTTLQKDQEIQKLKQEIDDIQLQNQKLQSEITTRSKVLSIHSQSSQHLLAQELQESHLKIQNQEKNTDGIQTNAVQIAQIEEQFLAEKEQYHQIIYNLMADIKKQEIMYNDLKKENNQNQQNYQHLLKIKYETGNLTPKIKKLELQNELLKKIVDAFIQTNSQC